MTNTTSSQIWTLLPADAPDYRIGTGVNLAASVLVLVLAIVVILWLDRDNKRRDTRDVEAELEGLNQTAIQSLDWKHPAFRWKL